MPNEEPKTKKQLAVRIAATTSDTEKEALRLWIEELLEIRASDRPMMEKARKAISVTAKSKVAVPTVKYIARGIKRLGWDERGVKGRLGIGGAATGLALFGTQMAGIAALGTAIGVPLWIVLGAGASFAGMLYEEITGKRSNDLGIDIENFKDRK